MSVTLTFTGIFLSAVQGKNTNYLKFKSSGMDGVEFQVSSSVVPQAEFVDLLADWELVGVKPVSGVKDGRGFAYFRCDGITGKLVKRGGDK